MKFKVGDKVRWAEWDGEIVVVREPDPNAKWVSPPYLVRCQFNKGGLVGDTFVTAVEERYLLPIKEDK